MTKEFDVNIADSQSTKVNKIACDQFDIEKYSDYSAKLLERNKEFVKAKSGIQLYRRFRADGVFYDKCADKKESLELQLGALERSMEFEADIANFLEPWYGIGYIASCFGSEYILKENQAPSVEAKFNSMDEVLKADVVPISQTPIGKHILEMIEYFLEMTQGKIPMSFSDVQSPLNMLSYLVPTTQLFMEVIMNEEGTKKVAKLVAELLCDFLKEQRKLIGDALAMPGHGFASSKAFSGLGFSNDNSIMLSEEHYTSMFMPADEILASEFDGICFHSCGNYEAKINMLSSYKNLKTTDAAFSIQTDPQPNDPSVFGEAFKNQSEVVINARAVGDKYDVFDVFSDLYCNNKVIAVSYLTDPRDQKWLYEKLHSL